MRAVTSRALVGFLLLATRAAAGVAGEPQVDLRDVAAAVERGRALFSVPGVAIGVVHHGEVVYAQGFGVRSLASGAGTAAPAVDEHTRFAVASNTKAFTATLLAMAADAGLLSLDDPVVDHVAEFRLFDAHATADLRVRDLLTHVSGLPTFGGDHLWIGSSLTSADILARLRFLRPTEPIRSKYQYQNLMYMVAGEVAAREFHEDWHALMRERILEPLGMRESLLSVEELPGAENVASAHEFVDGVLQVVDYDDVDAVAPAAALISNVLDMCRWMQFHLGDGTVGERRLVSAQRMRELHTMQVALPVTPVAEARFDRHFSGYALGWGVSDFRGRVLLTHGGGLTGMISRQALVPQEELGVLVLTNEADQPLAAALSSFVLDHFLVADPAARPDWIADHHRWNEEQRASAEAERAKLRAARHPDTTPSLPLSAYTGTYSSPLSGSAKVELRDGTLWFELNPRHVGSLEHWHHDTFLVHWRHPIFDMEPETFLDFELGRDGAVAGLAVDFYHRNEFHKD